jgi:nicotinate-nucleotide pyrophosphorylase (carboxylating)
MIEAKLSLPHLRYIEKKAVLIGGGDPHRFSLSDAVMIKDTHLELADLNVLANTVPFIMNGA